MYKLLSIGLTAISGIAIIFGFANVITFDGLRLLYSLILLLGICYSANYLLAKFFRAVTNNESAVISALILFCIFSPPRTLAQGCTLAAVGIVAMASKYILAFRQRHIFNPVAIAAAIVAVCGFAQASWWIATAPMLPFVGLLGLAVVRKTRRGWMVGTFMAVALFIILTNGFADDRTIGAVLNDAFTVWPLIFFGTIMLTEPLTTPPTQRLRLFYAAIIGFLFASGLEVGAYVITPEIALAAANIFAFSTGVRQRILLRLTSIREIAANTFEYNFMPLRPFRYLPGQYLEITLPHPKNDLRGARRYFTIASSPTEKEVKLGIKFYQPSSTFKQALRTLTPGQIISAPQVAGDFTLPTDPQQKLLWIAGGIGITPFRSMVQYLIDTNQHRDIILLYAAGDETQIAYAKFLESATHCGIKIIYILAKPPKNWKGKSGFINEAIVAANVPDITERTVYISGPPIMVEANKKVIRRTGGRRIITDYFAGY